MEVLVAETRMPSTSCEPRSCESDAARLTSSATSSLIAPSVTPTAAMSFESVTPVSRIVEFAIETIVLPVRSTRPTVTPIATVADPAAWPP